MSSDTIYEVHESLAILTFNKPGTRNAMTWEMYQGLLDACEQVDADAAVRGLVIRGAGGKAFVAGTDIAQFQDFKQRESGTKYEERLDFVVDRLERVTKPTLAQVQGVAAGAGCVIAMACDLCIASPESTFGVPIARTLGNCLSAATCSRMINLLGPHLTRELLFTGRLITAVEAHGAGVVNRVVPAEELDRVAQEWLAEIASNAPLTIRATKETIRRVLAKGRLDSGEDRDLVEMCYTSADFREGVTAFLEKRRPRWTGR